MRILERLALNFNLKFVSFLYTFSLLLAPIFYILLLIKIKKISQAVRLVSIVLRLNSSDHNSHTALSDLNLFYSETY